MTETERTDRIAHDKRTGAHGLCETGLCRAEGSPLRNDLPELPDGAADPALAEHLAEHLDESDPDCAYCRALYDAAGPGDHSDTAPVCDECNELLDDDGACPVHDIPADR